MYRNFYEEASSGLELGHVKSNAEPDPLFSDVFLRWYLSCLLIFLVTDTLMICMPQV